MRIIFSKISFLLLGGLMLILPSGTFAALDTHLNAVGGQITGDASGVPSNLPNFIGKLINAFLSVLGVIFLVLTVFAGYLWMTAGGDATKVEKAKKLLGQAVIGLIIIVGAYAISAFVINKISTAS